jgi:RNA polymerase sigma-70 factor (ECF subfamily)
MSSRDARIFVNNPATLEQLAVAQDPIRADGAAAPGAWSLLGRIKLTMSSDEELVAKLQAGHTEALAVLFERHSALVFRNARRVLRNSAEAEDLVQQVFFDLLRSAHKFDPGKGSFKTWLLMLAYCRTVNRWRRLQSTHYYDSANVEDVLPEVLQLAQRPFPFQGAEAACLVEQALEMVQPRQRRTIELIYYEGLTAEEVAERTGESAPSVRHNLYRGLAKLRSVMQMAATDKKSSISGSPKQVEPEQVKPKQASNE